MQILRFITSRDILLGLIYVGVGLVYGIYALVDLPMGTATNMGPGYFPMILSVLMVLIGVAVVVAGVPHWRTKPFGAVNWRSVIAISVSTLVFGLLARPAGMIPATIATSLVASLASRHVTWKGAILTAIILAGFCTLVFIYGMQLPIGMFGTWFR